MCDSHGKQSPGACTSSPLAYGTEIDSEGTSTLTPPKGKRKKKKKIKSSDSVLEEHGTQEDISKVCVYTSSSEDIDLFRFHFNTAQIGFAPT